VVEDKGLVHKGCHPRGRVQRKSRRRELFEAKKKTLNPSTISPFLRCLPYSVSRDDDDRPGSRKKGGKQGKRRVVCAISSDTYFLTFASGISPPLPFSFHHLAVPSSTMAKVSYPHYAWAGKLLLYLLHFLPRSPSSSSQLATSSSSSAPSTRSSASSPSRRVQRVTTSLTLVLSSPGESSSCVPLSYSSSFGR
jgi:hypothetical protein